LEHGVEGEAGYAYEYEYQRGGIGKPGKGHLGDILGSDLDDFGLLGIPSLKLPSLNVFLQYSLLVRVSKFNA
jgi:hypothetical protein